MRSLTTKGGMLAVLLAGTLPLTARAQFGVTVSLDPKALEEIHKLSEALEKTGDKAKEALGSLDPLGIKSRQERIDELEAENAKLKDKVSAVDADIGRVWLYTNDIKQPCIVVVKGPAIDNAGKPMPHTVAITMYNEGHAAEEATFDARNGMVVRQQGAFGALVKPGVVVWKPGGTWWSRPGTADADLKGLK